jgi:DNA (cytosine-5)-methyltransferase 1
MMARRTDALDDVPVGVAKSKDDSTREPIACAPVAISLFTGAGGLDYGFEAAGFRTAVALERDARCCETLRRNRDWPLIERDIAEVSTSELLVKAGLEPGGADVLIGGPPCQPFSKSGFWATGQAKRLGDPRASTLECYMRVLGEARPRAFLLENVEGLGFKSKDEGLQLIQSRLAALNAEHGVCYEASIATLNAADFGVPQQRRRMFVIGARDGTPFRFPEPIHGTANDLFPAVEAFRTAWDAFHDLAEAEEPDLALKGKWASLLPTIPPGRNYLWHTDRGGGEPLFGWRRRYWSFLLKLAADQPSWTIQAVPGPATGPFHWENRRLTIREMARLQTFPDDVEICGGLLEAQRQLGNAVPSLLAEVLAHEIRHQLLGHARTRELTLALTKAPIPPPIVTTPSAVPEEYLALRGDHEAHPGTGLGPGAQSRKPTKS